MRVNLKPMVISGIDITKAQVKREACMALRNVKAARYELKENKRVVKINKNNYLNYV